MSNKVTPRTSEGTLSSQRILRDVPMAGRMRVDTTKLGPRDGVSVGGCRTDTLADQKSEFRPGVTALEIVVWIVAGAMTALVITPDLGGLIWSFLK